MKPTQRTYPGKILLFGEYTVLLGSNALAIPSTHFYSSWSTNKEVYPLQDFYAYLLQNSQITNYLDSEKIKYLLDTDMRLNSNIKIGYGAGSSGSVVAAVYDFCSNSTKELSITKNHLALMENFFHGESSGFDPLISLMNKPLLSADTGIQKVQQHKKLESYQLFLVDTGISRSTETFVNLFKEKRKTNKSFDHTLSELKEANNQAIHHFINADEVKLFNSFKKISSFQFAHFAEMIPSSFIEYWQNGIESNEYYLKLCGAGGGGYLLGICKKSLNIEHEIKEEIIRI